MIEKGTCCRGRLFAIAGKNGGGNRKAISVKEPIDVERIEPSLARSERLGDDLTAFSVSDTNSVGTLGGVSIRWRFAST